MPLPVLQGFTIIRHNNDLLANLLTEVCHDISVEPHLRPLTGESLSYLSVNTADNARLDVAASGFWGGRFERAFLMLGSLIPTLLQTGLP